MLTTARLKALIVIATIAAAALAYALIPSGVQFKAQTETFTVDNLVAQTSIKDNGLTASTMVTTDGSKVLAPYAGSACGAGSAMSGLTSAGGATCVAAGSGTLGGSGSAGFITAFATPTTVQNWSGSGCGGGSAIQTISGSGSLTCVAAGGGGMSIGGTVTSGTTGSVLYVKAGPVLGQNNNDFFWDNTKSYLGIQTAGSPFCPLDVRASNPANEIIDVTNVSASGYSDVTFKRADSALQGAIGFGNSAVGITGFQNLNFLFSNGPDWVFGNGTGNQFQFGMTGASAFLGMASGASSAVSPSGAGRIIYNASLARFQESSNAGSYFNFLVSNYIVGTSTSTSVDHGSLATGSDDFVGSVTGVGANTTVTLTYGVAAANRSRCFAQPNSTSVALENIVVTAQGASSATFSCFSVLTAVAANCDDFTYQCLKQ